MPTFGSPFSFRSQVPRRTSQQDLIAAQLLKQGSSTAPVQSGLEGIARALTGVVGGFTARQENNRREDRETAFNDTLSRALASGNSTATETQNPSLEGTVPQQTRAQILAGNPDTAGLGLQFQLSQEQQERALSALGAANTREDEQREEDRVNSLALAQTKANNRQPKTVKVNGRVHILNSDGSLGEDLGAEDQFLAVPGVGVFEPGKGTFVGQSQTPEASAQLPAPSNDPTAALPPALRGKAQAAELAAANSELRKDRESLTETLKVAEAARRFGELLEIQETGGVLRNLPGAQSVEGAFDPEIKEMASIIDRITPLMRQGLPGAASERDTAMFRGAAFGTDKDPQTNRNLIQGFQTSAQIAQDRIAYRDAYVSQNGFLRGSEESWLEYLEANPIFDPNSDVRSPQLNPRRQSWQEFFGGVTPSEFTGFKVRKIK